MSSVNVIPKTQMLRQTCLTYCSYLNNTGNASTHFCRFIFFKANHFFWGGRLGGECKFIKHKDESANFRR